jgi:molybdate transport system regulatory protein
LTPIREIPILKKMPENKTALWLLFRERELLVKDRILLLKKIEETGSLSRAAKAVGLSYKSAWDTVDSLNNLAEKPLVAKITGGRAGGGSALTDYGREIIGNYRVLESEYKSLTGNKKAFLDGVDLARTLDRFAFRISARNQFLGAVRQVSVGLVNSEVVVSIGAGMDLTVLLMREGVNALGLKEGMAVIAFFKATAPILAAGTEPPKTSVKNCLPGKVTEIRKGRVNAEVKLDLGEGRILAAAVSLNCLSDMEIRKGRHLFAIVPSSQILIALA